MKTDFSFDPMLAAMLDKASAALKLEARAIAAQTASLDQSFFSLCQYLVENQHTTFVSGVGKSGLVSRMIASKLACVGVRAVYLEPMDALHGELGLVGSADLLIVLSKSGTTGELVALTRAAKQRNAKIAAMVCRSSSPLAKLADWIISVQIEQEATDIEVPTASTVAMSALGDALMIAVAHGRGFTAAEFSHNHPAGNLGVLLGSQVDELMLRIPGSVPLVSSQDLLRDVVIEMTRHPVGAAIVADPEGKLVGLITDGDLRRQIQSSPEAFLQATVDACMTPEPLYCQSGMSALEAMRFMEQNPRKPVYVLPVVDEDHKVLGLLRMHDLATLQMKEGNVDV